MPRLRWIRLVGISVATGIVAGTAVLGWAAPPASAASPGLCTLLPALCPPAAPATTKPAPATTAPPKTTPPTTARAPAITAATTPRTTTASRNASAVSSVGAGVLPPSVAAVPGSTPDDAVPELAGLPTTSTTAISAASVAPQALSGLGGATSGLPNDHSTLRVLLSLVVLLIAAVAVAQLPASRRLPRPRPERLG